jgi:hypothetical protein
MTLLKTFASCLRIAVATRREVLQNSNGITVFSHIEFDSLDKLQIPSLSRETEPKGCEQNDSKSRAFLQRNHEPKTNDSPSFKI